jgi:tetratricopeptide (TPR) repeat protein
MSDMPPLGGQVVVFVGSLTRVTRREAGAAVERQQGRVAPAVSRATTILVIGEGGADRVERGESLGEAADDRRVAEARRLNERHPGRVRLMSAAEFYRLVGVDTGDVSSSAEPALYGSRTIRSLYPVLREDRLRDLERWGLVRPVREDRHERFYSFADLTILRQVSAELARGVSFRAVVRELLASRQGQLSLDFQMGSGDGQVARVIALPGRAAEVERADRATSPDAQALDLASQYFADGAEMDTGDADQREAAMTAYRRALALDPSMTAALVNLANIHYAQDQTVEAEALYEKALASDPTCFEAHFNLGNVCHDTGRFDRAARCYQQALALDPAYADAHFYLAVTLEKLGRSADARPHWLAYQKLAPTGEWVELAREFSE